MHTDRTLGKYEWKKYWQQHQFYNLKTKQWEQLWIDNSGTHLKLKGNRVGDQMIMSSNPSIRKDGKAYVDRITWTLNADGSVR